MSDPKGHDGFSIEEVRPEPDAARRIMTWRNDPQTLASFYHREPKVWDRFWPEFQSTYFTEPTLPPLFVVRDGTPVAFCRYQWCGHPLGAARRCCDASINVDPSLRGQGIGVVALELTADFLRSRGVEDVLAEIRAENAASIRTFERAGYAFVDRMTKHIADTGEDCAIVRYLLKVA